MTNDVPNITITGDVAASDAVLPKGKVDTCACWTDKDRRAARKLLKSQKPVHCQDATAFAGITSMALDMAIKGYDVTRQKDIIRNWEQ